MLTTNDHGDINQVSRAGLNPIPSGGLFGLFVRICGVGQRMLASQALLPSPIHPPLSHFPSPFPTMAGKAAQKRVCIPLIAPVSLAQRPRLAIQGIYQHAEGAPAVCLGSP